MSTQTQQGVPPRNWSDSQRRDRTCVLKAVRKQGYVLQFAAAELRDDPEVFPFRFLRFMESGVQVVLAALRQDCRALRYASDRLQCSRPFLLDALKSCGRLLKHLHEQFRCDHEMVLSAMQDANILQWAAVNLRGDRDVVHKAVSQAGEELQYASEGIRRDRSIVLAAVKQNGLSLQWASGGLQSDKEIVQYAVNQDPAAMQYAGAWKDSEEMVVFAVMQHGRRACVYTSQRLKTFQKEALQQARLRRATSRAAEMAWLRIVHLKKLCEQGRAQARDSLGGCLMKIGMLPPQVAQHVLELAWWPPPEQWDDDDIDYWLSTDPNLMFLVEPTGRSYYS